jgi:hypothetical protein
VRDSKVFIFQFFALWPQKIKNKITIINSQKLLKKEKKLDKLLTPQN